MRRYCLAVGVLLVSMVCLEGSASAVIAAPQTVSADGPSDSSNKSMSVSCPAGKRVLGTGGWISLGNTNQVLIDHLVPSADLTSASIGAFEDATGTDEDWNITAAAVCATPPPGLERVSATSPINSSNKGVTASCPAGKQVLGTGADLNTFNGHVVLANVRPNPALTSVTVRAFEDETGNPLNWSVTAYAVCANSIAGLERVSEPSPLDSSAPKILFNACPGGKVLTGLGADLNTINGQVQLGAINFGGIENTLLIAFEDETGNSANWGVTSYLICVPGARREFFTTFADSNAKNANVTCANPAQLVTGLGGVVLDGNSEVLLERFRPDPPNNANVAAFEDDGGFTGNWQLSANAVCVTPLPGQEIVANATPQVASASKNVSVSCPSGKRVVGAAGEIFNGLGQVLLDDVRPSADLTAVTVNAGVDETGTTRTWSLTARAICADPLPGLERVSGSSALDSTTPKAAAAVCPAGKTLLSAAYDLNTFNGQVLLGSLSPTNLLTQAIASGIEDANGNPANWSVTAYGICALP
jgi:hypothetical protein